MHLPGHLRDTFADLVEKITESGTVPRTITYRDNRKTRTSTTRQFLRRFVGCTDVVPGGLRSALLEEFFQTLGLDPPEAAFGTYARAARRVDELRRGCSDLVL